jgi:hypothetical protein
MRDVLAGEHKAIQEQMNLALKKAVSKINNFILHKLLFYLYFFVFYYYAFFYFLRPKRPMLKDNQMQMSHLIVIKEN